MSDGKTQRCQEGCQKEAPKIHAGKKEGQKSRKVEIAEQPWGIAIVPVFEQNMGRCQIIFAAHPCQIAAWVHVTVLQGPAGLRSDYGKR